MKVVPVAFDAVAIFFQIYEAMRSFNQSKEKNLAFCSGSIEVEQGN